MTKSLVTRPGQFYFASENPIDTYRVCQDDGNADAGDDQHDAKGLLGGSGVINVQGIFRFGPAIDKVRVLVYGE